MLFLDLLKVSNCDVWAGGHEKQPSVTRSGFDPESATPWTPTEWYWIMAPP